MAPHILAVLIFVVMFVLIVMDKIERQYVSLGCGLLMIVLVFGLGMHSKDAIVETLNVKSIFRASFWYTAAYYGHPVFGGSYAGAGADAQV